MDEINPQVTDNTYNEVTLDQSNQKVVFTASGDYKVKIEAFEGPLDLLLSLIEKRKLHISDISLGKITDDYLSYIENTKDFPMHSAASFVLVASTLVLIKSRSLLPTLKLTEDEEEDIEVLESRLREYKKYKDLSVFVQEKFGQQVIFHRKASPDVQPVFSPTHELTRENIFESIKRVLAHLPKKELIPQVVVQKMITLEEMTESLTERITSALFLSFKEFSGGNNKAKSDIVVGFLAMLELVRRGIISVKQDKHFSDIHMESKEKIGIPKYH